MDYDSSDKLGADVPLPTPVDEDDAYWDLMIEGPEIPDCEIKIGYILKSSAWGNSYTTEVCTCLFKFFFEEAPVIGGCSMY